ncbi:uncharacterized protein [Oscarella lobularis]|uniref:uncharacterized protein isoform X2 n=1 Tax=Oscarella lobularis TaxID=121494 RepID=UPI0033141634
MTLDPTKTVVGIFAVSGLGLLLDIVGVAIPQWTVEVVSTVAGIFDVSGLGLLLNIVAVAIPQWKVAVGPFQSVVKLGLCNVSAEAYIYAVRAMTILSILFEASSMAGTVEALRKIRSDSGKFRKRAKESGEMSDAYISCRRSHCLRS